MSDTAAVTTPRKVTGELRARCSVLTCQHKWVVAYLPMPLNTVAALAKRAACPMCGNTNPKVAP